MSAIAVSRALPHELACSVRVFVGGPAGPEQDRLVERCVAAFTTGEYDPDGLFITHDESGRVNGAELVQTLAGAMAVAWQPRGAGPAVEDALTHAACRWLQTKGVKVCQSFAPGGESQVHPSLGQNGFRHITQLIFLRREVGGSPAVMAPRVTCLPVTGGFSSEFANVLLQTHTGSLDCPEMNVTRAPEEIIAGFLEGKGKGINHAAWYEVREGNRLAGVVLFDKGAGPSTLELSYLGLVPSTRGRGLGREILSRVMEIAAALSYPVLSVSVDARNLPAMRLYERMGFTETERREVFLAHWPAAPN